MLLLHAFMSPQIYRHIFFYLAFRPSIRSFITSRERDVLETSRFCYKLAQVVYRARR